MVHGTHRPLLQIILGSTLERYFDPESVAFALGSGGSVLSDISGRFFCWLAFYLAIVVFYRTIPPAIRSWCERRYPDAPTSAVPQKLVDNMVEVSSHAFPLYVTVALLTDFFLVKGWSMACDSVEDCGGPVRSVLGCVGYFFALEAIIFFDHYYLLHKWDVGKRLGQHAYHHVYKYADQLNAFSGYSFAPQDGWSQGMALPLATLFVPVPIAFVFFMEVLTGLWTLYIHTDLFPLPWPLMGCDYHYIHHRYNWYNFGFMTLLFDSMCHARPQDVARTPSRPPPPAPVGARRRISGGGRHATACGAERRRRPAEVVRRGPRRCHLRRPHAPGLLRRAGSARSSTRRPTRSRSRVATSRWPRWTSSARPTSRRPPRRAPNVPSLAAHNAPSQPPHTGTLGSWPPSTLWRSHAATTQRALRGGGVVARRSPKVAHSTEF